MRTHAVPPALLPTQFVANANNKPTSIKTTVPRSGELNTQAALNHLKEAIPPLLDHFLRNPAEIIRYSYPMPSVGDRFFRRDIHLVPRDITIPELCLSKVEEATLLPPQNFNAIPLGSWRIQLTQTGKKGEPLPLITSSALGKHSEIQTIQQDFQNERGEAITHKLMRTSHHTVFEPKGGSRDNPFEIIYAEPNPLPVSEQGNLPRQMDAFFNSIYGQVNSIFS